MAKMYHYVRLRRLGSLDARILREDGKILVFRNKDAAKKQAKEGYDTKIISIPVHPMNKASPIYGKDYKLVGW